MTTESADCIASAAPDGTSGHILYDPSGNLTVEISTRVMIRVSTVLDMLL